jgi:hypothetical protein
MAYFHHKAQTTSILDNNTWNQHKLKWKHQTFWTFHPTADRKTNIFPSNGVPIDIIHADHTKIKTFDSVTSTDCTTDHDASNDVVRDAAQ